MREIVLSGCQGRCGLRPFYNKEEKSWRKRTCSAWGSQNWQTAATGSFPAASHILHIGAKVFFGTKEEYLNSDAGKIFLMQQEGGEDDV